MALGYLLDTFFLDTLFPRQTIHRHDISKTRQFLDTTFPRHDNCQTRHFLDTTFPRHDISQTRHFQDRQFLDRHFLDTTFPRHDNSQTRNFPDTTIHRHIFFSQTKLFFIKKKKFKDKISNIFSLTKITKFEDKISNIFSLTIKIIDKIYIFFSTTKIKGKI